MSASLAEELDAAESNKACHICAYVQTLDRPSREAWAAEFDKPRELRSSAAIARVLEKKGVNTSESAVKRHRSNHHAV